MCKDHVWDALGVKCLWCGVLKCLRHGAADCQLCARIKKHGLA